MFFLRTGPHPSSPVCTIQEQKRKSSLPSLLHLEERWRTRSVQPVHSPASWFFFFILISLVSSLDFSICFVLDKLYATIIRRIFFEMADWQMEKGIEEEEKKGKTFLFSLSMQARARVESFILGVKVRTFSFSSPSSRFREIIKKIHNQCLAKDVVDEPIDTATISNFPPSPLRWRLTIFFKEEKKRKKKSLKNWYGNNT